MTNQDVERIANNYYAEKDFNKRADIFFEIDRIVRDIKEEERPSKFFLLTNILIMG